MYTALWLAILTLFGSCTISFSQTSYDYYWRDYTGDIPKDAVTGGLDINKRVTYIGQVYIKNFGIAPGIIYPGKVSVTTSKGIFTSYIKILCSTTRNKFKWLPGNAKDLHLTMINKHLVRGGVEWDAVSNIGRIHYQGELLVAKICSFNIGNALLFFRAGNKEHSAASYEVLVYEN